MPTTTIYDSLGGETGVAEIIEELYRRLLDDPTTKPQFDGVDMPRQIERFTAWFSGAVGGPDTYRGPSLRATHAGLGIDDEQFNTTAVHLMAILNERNTADDVITQIAEALTALRPDIVTA